jgi:hypothetical protein
LSWNLRCLPFRDIRAINPLPIATEVLFACLAAPFFLLGFFSLCTWSPFSSFLVGATLGICLGLPITPLSSALRSIWQSSVQWLFFLQTTHFLSLPLAEALARWCTVETSAVNYE